MALLKDRISKMIFASGDSLRVYTTSGGEVVRVFARPRIPANTAFEAEGRWASYKGSPTFTVSAFTSLVNSRGKALPLEQAPEAAASVAIPEATPEGIATWIRRSKIAGVGATTAATVAGLGADAPSAIADVEALVRLGVRRSRAEALSQAWARALHAPVHAKILSLGVPYALASRLVLESGADAADALARDPWRMARLPRGMRFAAADAIATSLRLDPTHPARLAAALHEILADAAKQGHTGVTGAIAREKGVRLLGIPAKALKDLLHEAAQDPAFSLEARYDTPAGRINVLQTAAERGREVRVATRLSRMQPPDPVRATRARADAATAAAAIGLRLEPEQETAVAMALVAPVSVTTGGPGTGKSASMAALVGAAGARGERIGLAAPTGRAARRLMEATGHPASTIHRMLGRRHDGRPMHDRENTLPIDLLVVDEASMLDGRLVDQLCDALAPATRLLLVGDADQLPSVGAGNVLADLIAAGAAPTTRLTRIHRQAEGSGIVAAALAVNAGATPLADDDVSFTNGADAASVCETVAALARRHSIDPQDVMVLTPVNEGPTGTKALNRALQARFNPSGAGAAEIVLDDVAFRHGDKVMQTRNDHDREVYNGELGRIVAVDAAGERVEVLFQDRDAPHDYERGEIRALRHAYATSVHKAQGSEAAHVVVALDANDRFTSRRLLYTAMTRAKKSLHVMARADVLARTIASVRDEARITGLRALLVEAKEERDLPLPF